MTLELEPQGSKTFACTCCGSTSHSVSGWVHDERGTRCAYFVHWADGGPHPPHMTLGYGRWGEGSTAADRATVFAELRSGRWEFVPHPSPASPDDQYETLGEPVRSSVAEQDAAVQETVEFIAATDERLEF
jgi:hypothetical protein